MCLVRLRTVVCVHKYEGRDFKCCSSAEGTGRFVLCICKIWQQLLENVSSDLCCSQRFHLAPQLVKKNPLSNDLAFDKVLKITP